MTAGEDRASHHVPLVASPRQHTELLPHRRRWRTKLMEWVARYGPAEILSTALELGGAATAYIATGSLAAAAVAGTVGALIGYYALVYGQAASRAYRQQKNRGHRTPGLISAGLGLRSVIAEFGPGECIDSLLVRPLLYLLAPIALDNVVIGWLMAKVIADVVFYACTITSYETCRSLIVRREELLSVDLPQPRLDPESVVQEAIAVTSQSPHFIRSHESSVSTYSRRLPIVPVEGRGVYLRDADGRWYLDCLAGAGAMSLGWNHPVVTEALRTVLDSGAPLLTLDFHNPWRDALVDELMATLPRGLADDCVVHLCSPSGANAVEAALMLAEIASGGSEHVAIEGGFHGCSRAARTVSSGGGLRSHPIQLSAPTHFLPFPQHYRCPFGVGGTAGTQLAIGAIDRLFTSPHSGLTRPASVLTEFVLGEGGVLPAQPEWAQALRRAATDSGVALIADEVQAGVYRTGTPWAFEHCDVAPDMIEISKGLGSGLPIAVLIIRRQFDEWGSGAFTGTFRGNTLAFAAATAVLRYAAKENLAAHVGSVGARLRRGLESIAQTATIIGDVRAIGLMAGAEIIDTEGGTDERGVAPANPILAAALQQACLRAGLIEELGGQYGNVVRFLPPLTITNTEVDIVLERFHDAVTQVDEYATKGVSAALTT